MVVVDERRERLVSARSRVHRPNDVVEVQASPIPVWRQRARVHLSIGGQLAYHVGQRRRLGNHPAVRGPELQRPTGQPLDLKASFVHEAVVTPAQ